VPFAVLCYQTSHTAPTREEVYLYQTSGEAPESSRHSRLFGVIVLIVPWVSPAAGAELSSHPPTFSQVLVFGDSTVDSGYFRTLPNPDGGKDFDDLWPKAVAAGAENRLPAPGFVYSEMLASCYGSNATSGAKNETVNKKSTGGFKQPILTTGQIAQYLSMVHSADAHGLYLISSGGNDVSFALGDTGDGPRPENQTASVVSAARTLASSIKSLYDARARYIIVPNLPHSFPKGRSAANANQRSLRELYSEALRSDIDAFGIKFVRADINAARLAIAANPSAFSLQFVDTKHPACKKPENVDTLWALLCSRNLSVPSTFDPDADQTHLFADNQHLTKAGQAIIADYIYGLLTPRLELPPASPSPSPTLPRISPFPPPRRLPI
jgi:phospholipase/lecithinase/hemolysin